MKLLSLFLIPVLLAAQAVHTGQHRFEGIDLPATTVASLPGAPDGNPVYVVTDCTAEDDCSAGGGTAVEIVRWDGSDWVVLTTGGGGGSHDPRAWNLANIFMKDDFPCHGKTTGLLGELGWGPIATIATNSVCGTDSGYHHDGILANAGNTMTGAALSRDGGITRGALSNLTGREFEAVWIVRAMDDSEIVYKIGIGDDNGSELVDHTASQQFIGVVFKNETTNSSGECADTTGTSANWQALAINGANTSGLQSLGVSMSTSTWYRIRIRSVPTGAEVCIVADSANPTFTACYTETTTNRIPSSSSSPFMALSSCDNSAVSGTSNLLRLHYFHVWSERY